MGRLGHVVLGCQNFLETEEWWKKHFGFVTTDEVRVNEEVVIGAFLRCDRGDIFTDHHTVVLMTAPKVELLHAAFEVADMEDLFSGHTYLKAKTEYSHSWGVGRHIIGSQIF